MCSPVLLGELDSDVVATECEATILVLIGPRRVGGLEELDEGEALDGAEVWAAAVRVSRDVDVADGAILLEHAAQLLDRDVAREVAGDDGLDARRVGRDNGGGRLDDLDSGLVRELHASAVGADGEDVRLALFRADADSTLAGLVVTDARDVAPPHCPVPQGFHNGVLETPPLELGGEVHNDRRCGNGCGHLLRVLEGLGKAWKAWKAWKAGGLSLCAGSTGYFNTAISRGVPCFNFFLNLTIFHVRKGGGGGGRRAGALP